MWKEEKPEEELSEYEKIWKKMRELINIKASDFVPSMYEALKKEGYSPKEARDKIKKDAFNIWKVDTIDRYIPEEAKQLIKVAAGQQKGKTKQEIENSNENKEDTNKDSAGLESSRPSDSASTKEDLEAINKNIAAVATGETTKEPEETTSSSTAASPSLQDQILDLSNLKIRLQEQILKLQKELDTTQQLLREERAKNVELEKELSKYRRLEQIRLEAQRKSLEAWKVPGDRPT